MAWEDVHLELLRCAKGPCPTLHGAWGRLCSAGGPKRPATPPWWIIIADGQLTDLTNSGGDETVPHICGFGCNLKVGAGHDGTTATAEGHCEERKCHAHLGNQSSSCNPLGKPNESQISNEHQIKSKTYNVSPKQSSDDKRWHDE